MSDLHFSFWPKNHPKELEIPQTSIWQNILVTAERVPDKTFILYYDTPITFGEFKNECEDLAGYLHQDCSIKKGDRVLLFMQNCPQFLISYYAVLRINAVVVPINPMNLTLELEHYIKDCGSNTIVVSQELLPQVLPILSQKPRLLKHVIVSCYQDYLLRPTDLRLPEFLKTPKINLINERCSNPGLVLWQDALKSRITPPPHNWTPDDLCVMPYTSGTTGKPKGCMHTHQTVMSTILASEHWFNAKSEDIRLAVLPQFHVTGMQSGMNCPVFAGSTIVLLSRWDRELAAQCIQRYKVTSFSCIPTMVVDFLANPNLAQYDLSSLVRMNGGGTAMPQAIAQKLLEMGLTFIEGYGLSETIAPSHINPPHRAKKQCLGIPIYGVDSFIVDPITLERVPHGESGEIVISGPQVFKGYWNRPLDTEAALININGKIYLRTGDLAREDEDGYFFMVDRLKRMINASGYKVWPAEVELMLYRHPSIQEACVISTKDAYRGETVKALIVLKAEAKGRTKEEEIIHWCQQEMAAYKAPKLIEFVDNLPKSGSGKILWRQLQDVEISKNLPS